jgi:uncharacterized protein (DUF305 family)
MKSPRLVQALALAAMVLGAAPASAADTMMAAPDCATANATLTTMAAAPMPAAGSSDLDTNFMTAMHAMSDHGMKMAKLEAACGKDAKTRELAAKMARDLQADLKLLQSGH